MRQLYALVETVSTEPMLSRSEYVVLGLIARYGAMSPYELKARVAESIGFFWPIPHAQLYRDPTRLADLGLLEETPEATGRRRRIFAITAAGRAELARWLADDHTTETQIRDPALLKLALADLADAEVLVSLAAGQAAVHQRWLQEYGQRLEALSADDPATPSRRHLLALGGAIEAAYADFWARLAEAERTAPPPDRRAHGH
jgi:DNA-binding PadR family transcriptional regulator